MRVRAGKNSETDECIGTLRIKVRDVVRNERIKDVWALQETQKGEAHLALEWRPIVLEECADLLPAGDLEEQKRRQASFARHRFEYRNFQVQIRMQDSKLDFKVGSLGLISSGLMSHVGNRRSLVGSRDWG